MKEKVIDKRKYSLSLTKKQVMLISFACDTVARLIEGQTSSFEQFLSLAWERRCREATGTRLDKDFEGGWWKMKRDAEQVCNDMKLRFWGLSPNESHGIRYDLDADILWDIHQVLRHRLWKDMDEGDDWPFVDGEDAPKRVGSEPLAEIKKQTKTERSIEL